jgi:alpha-L-arabinofuranosidase
MRPAATLALVLAAASLCRADDARIRVHADRVISHVTPYTTGACLEDVNHEVYGGIYSQMLFGESFQEPHRSAAIKGFTRYGGRWDVHNGVLTVESDPGAKLVSDHAPFGTGEVGVELFLPGRSGGVAGLIVKVGEPGPGIDRFVGYEISLATDRPRLILGRHRHNWEPIKEVPCAVPADRWVPLVVRLEEATIEVLVDGKSILTYKDREHPLAAGRVGVRTFNRPCRYRSLWVKTDDKTQRLPFEAENPWDEGLSGPWRGVRTGNADGRFTLETDRPFLGRQSQRIMFVKGKGDFGIENRGLNRWGLAFTADKPYEGYVWLRAEQDTEVVASLESLTGERVHAEMRLRVSDGDWQRFDFVLTPEGTERAGRFALTLTKPGSVLVGHAFLQPGPWGRFKGLPVRKDVAEGLVAQGLTVLRYGGSMINAPEYRWKKMLGPRDRRPPYRGTWYPHSSNGWGILDFLDFCEAAGFLAVPAFNMDETPQDMVDFLDYVNGSASSPWTRKRVAAGHQGPYRLKYLELGNEEAVDENYWKRFKPLAEAMWAKDPDIVLVVGDFAYNGRIKDPFNFTGAPNIKSLAAHKKILELAKKHNRPVWFDVHVWNDQPRHPDELGGGIIGLRDFGAALAKLCPGAEYKVCVFEENAGNHRMRRGLAHAHAVNELQRSGDLVPIVCAANCLQPYGQNDNDWDQGLLFLSPGRVWGQPSYYVTQMLARHYLPCCVRADVESPRDALDVTARKSKDGKTLQLQVVNLDGRPVPSTVQLEGFVPAQSMARVIELAGRLEDLNTPGEPRKIIPRERDWRHEIKEGRLQYTFPPYSFTIIVLE